MNVITGFPLQCLQCLFPKEVGNSLILASPTVATKLHADVRGLLKLEAGPRRAACWIYDRSSLSLEQHVGALYGCHQAVFPVQ